MPAIGRRTYGSGGGGGGDPHAVDPPADAADAADAIEAALAAAAARISGPLLEGLPAYSYIRLLAGDYRLSRPIFVPDGVDIEGEGWATRVFGYDATAGRRTHFPLFVYGVLDPGDCTASRPDLFGTLDTTACPTSGVRYGWDTEAQGYSLQGQFCAFNLGRFEDYWDYYRGDQLTLDVCLVRPEGGWTPGVPLLGCGKSYDLNQPRGLGTLVASPTPGYFLWRGIDDRATADAALGNVGVSFPDPDTPVVRISLQVDLAAGTAAAWTNGVRRAVTLDGFVGGRTLRGNSDWPFMVGRQGYKAADPDGPPTPLVLAGLRVQTGLRYAWGTPGAAQARVGGGAINDLWQFFDTSDLDGTFVGCLPLTDPRPRRWLTVHTPSGFAECLLVIAGVQGGGKPNRLAHLAVSSDGPCVLLGAVINWRGEDLRLKSGAAAGLASMPCIMSYPITLADSIVSGADAAISLGQAIAHIHRCNIENQGLDGIRSRGASLDIRNCMASFSGPIAETFVRYYAGGEGHASVTLADAHIDFENPTEGTSVSLVAAEAETNLAFTLKCDNVITANSGPTQNDPRPFAVLSGTGGVARFTDVVGVFKGALFAYADGSAWTVVDDSPGAVIVP